MCSESYVIVCIMLIETIFRTVQFIYKYVSHNSGIINGTIFHFVETKHFLFPSLQENCQKDK